MITHKLCLPTQFLSTHKYWVPDFLHNHNFYASQNFRIPTNLATHILHANNFRVPTHLEHPKLNMHAFSQYHFSFISMKTTFACTLMFQACIIICEGDWNCGKFIVLAITKCQINHNYLRGVLIEDFVHIGKSLALWNKLDILTLLILLHLRK